MLRTCRQTLLASILLTTAGVARAEEPAAQAAGATAAPAPLASAPPTSSEPPSRRELAGHVFMPALGITSPFTTTSFATYLVVGEGTTKGSVTVQLPGAPGPETFTGDVSYAAVGGVLAYEKELLHGLSARFLFNETLYSGTTGAAVAVVGTNARFGLGLGLTLGTDLGESFRVAGIVDATYAPRIGLLLGPAIKAAYDSCSPDPANCTFDFAKLFEQNNVFQVQPGVSAAWAATRSLGVTGNVTYVYQSLKAKDGTTSSESAVAVGAAVDFDLGALTSVALGLQVTWSSQLPIKGGDAARFTDLGGGIFYTGRKDLSLGLQVVDRRFAVVPQVDVSWDTLLVTTGLRYYW